uniref:Uncharacterized protein n=1 Tax=Rhizophora mucronata TaxID=61149 RepID=A0A2P2QFR4_RHIMU
MWLMAASKETIG